MVHETQMDHTRRLSEHKTHSVPLPVCGAVLLYSVTSYIRLKPPHDIRITLSRSLEHICLFAFKFKNFLLHASLMCKTVQQ